MSYDTKTGIIIPQLAIVTVSNKAGLKKLAAGLNRNGVEIVSTGGTAKEIAGANIPVTAIHEFLRVKKEEAEMLDGLIKTLHTPIFAGIMADRQNPEHMAFMKERGWKLVDIYIGNFYPFSENPMIGNIDIGGPSGTRAAGKNYEGCCPVPAPDAYDELIELIENGGITREFRRKQFDRLYGITSRFDAEVNDAANASQI